MHRAKAGGPGENPPGARPVLTVVVCVCVWDWCWQVVSTLPGERYVLSWAMTAAPFSRVTGAHLRVRAGSVAVSTAVELNADREGDWHTRRLEFVAHSTTALLSFWNLPMDANTSVLVDGIRLERCEAWAPTDRRGLRFAASAFNGRSGIHVLWDLAEEPALADVQLAVGTTPGGAQLQPFTEVHGLRRFDLAPEQLAIPHGTRLYATLWAKDEAGNEASWTSEAATLDLTPPLLDGLVDGLGAALGEDESHSAGAAYSLSWRNSSDPESGMVRCEWGVGLQADVPDVLPFRALSAVELDARAVSAGALGDGRLREGSTLYGFLRCWNAAGGAAEAVTNGLVVARGQAPDVEAAYLEVETMARFEAPLYSGPNLVPEAGQFQASAGVMTLRWGGFQDPTGIGLYEFHVARLASCRGCRPRYEVEDLPCVGEYDAVCRDVPVACTSREFLVVETDGPGQCRPCQSCPEGQYAARACTAASDTLCLPRTRCLAGQYERFQGDARFDRQCAACRACHPTSEYQLAACNATHDAVCVRVRECEAGGSFEGDASTATSDRVCTACTACGANATVAKECTLTEDRQCCGDGSECVPPGVSCPEGQRRLGAACLPCTACNASYFDAGGCDGVSGRDRVCQAQSVCGAGFFETKAATATSDRVCQRCTACRSGFLAEACTESADGTCQAYTAVSRCLWETGEGKGDECDVGVSALAALHA